MCRTWRYDCGAWICGPANPSRCHTRWPDQRVAVECDGFDWRVVSIVSDDVRRRAWEMNLRIGFELDRLAA